MTSRRGPSADSPIGADAFRAVGLAAVCLGIAVLAAATFVVSYQGIRAVALQAGILPRYARGYPILVDAMLVIALAAVLALRGAGVPSRLLSWLTLLVVLGAAAGADTLHATGRTLPHNAAVITAAVLPWALVFVAFVLLLAMLRHARLRRPAGASHTQPAWTQPADTGQAAGQQPVAAPPPLPVRSPQPWNSVSIVPGFTTQLASSAAAGAAAGAVTDIEPAAQGGTALGDAPPQHAGEEPESTAAGAAEPATQAAAGQTGDETNAPDDDTDAAEAGRDQPADATSTVTG